MRFSWWTLDRLHSEHRGGPAGDRRRRGRHRPGCREARRVVPL